MECLRSFRRGDGETSLKGRVERSLDPPEANAARPTPWTLQAMLASAFFCRGPPSADDDDVHVPPRASASGPRKPGMRRPPSASSLPDIPESGVGDPAGAGDAASADAVEVILPDDSPSRRPPAGAAGGEPARKLSHRRSWSWSMQWSAGEPSAKARRKHESGERGTRAPAEADAADEDGFSDVSSERRREDDDERDDDGKEDVSAAGSSTNAAREDLGRSRPSHSRSGSWSDWASVSASAWFASKTPEEREEARRARAEKMEKKARHLADAEALRARAAEENDQLDRVMRESKRLHEDSLPLKTRSRDGAAACVLVTPPPKNARRRRTRGEAGDEAVDEAVDENENESDDDDDDDDDDDALGADGVDAGEWVDVELRGAPSRWATRATASASEASQTDAQSHASRPETSGEGEKRRKIRARAFFATLDQRGARGEGSCTLFCVALAEWLAANPGLLPTEETRTILPSTSSASPESEKKAASDGRDGVETPSPFGTTSPPPRFALDFIVTGAAREWRRLCSDASLVARFPDKHLDLDTAAALHAPFSVEAETRACVADAEAGGDAASVREGAASALDDSKTKTKTKRLLRAKIHHGESFVGFLRPPGVAKGDSPALDALAEAAPPLSAIVRELAASPAPTCSYAVSWNDHFFLLHFRREAGETVAYVMDSLGERLCEGCRRAYVLRFDGDSLSSSAIDGQSATGRQDQDEAPAEEREPADAAAAAAAFIGDVLPSRALRDVGARILAKNAEDPDPETLMRRLQIEFHRVQAERA